MSVHPSSHAPIRTKRAPLDSHTHPLHREVEEARAGATTTRNPIPRAHTARVVKRAGKRNTAAKTHFQSNLSSQVGWHVIVNLCCTVLDDVNAFLLQHAPNLLNILHIHASNTNATPNLAITMLNDLNLKRDAVQTKNDFPAQ